MAPTALEKALIEQKTLNITLGLIETRLTSHTISPLHQTEISHLITEVDFITKEYKDAHIRILNTLPAEPEPYDLAFTNFSRKVLGIICGLKAMETPVTGAFQASASLTADIRLPRLELPNFSGESTEWLSFSDQFRAAVHNNTKLSDVSRLAYLKSSLTGDAVKVIKSMATTEANYGIAWKALKEPYENRRVMTYAVLNRLLGQPTITGDYATKLRSHLDTTRECIRSLEVLQEPIQHWDTILGYIVYQKANSATKQGWELSLMDNDVPKLVPMLEFLEQRAKALAVGGADLKGHPQSKSNSDGNVGAASRRSVNAHHINQATWACCLCSGSHFLFTYPEFIVMELKERRDVINKFKLCLNCLRRGHFASNCSSKFGCKSFKGRHHSLVHPTVIAIPQLAAATLPDSVELGRAVCGHSNNGAKTGSGMLATAVIKILDKYGVPQFFRALLDGGSTASFITEYAAKRLGLKMDNLNVDVSELGLSNLGRVSNSLLVNLRPYFHLPGDDEFPVQLLIMNNLTAALPTHTMNPQSWPHLGDLQLADPEFYRTAKVDIMFGADIFWDLLLDGKKHGTSYAPIVLRSKLGWLVAGNINNASSNIVIHHADVKLNEAVQQFWQLESVSSARVIKKEEEEAENHFQSTHTRDSKGIFTVSLPFKGAHSKSSGSFHPERPLVSSQDMAIQRLKSIERGFEKQPQHKQQYSEFMEEYLTLGHMEAVPPSEIITSVGLSYYIPHHFVLKESSTTTKLRVVFDASCKSISGISLNDKLMVGLTIQDNLADILMRFRTHVIALTADITKMYRQVHIAPAHRDWQRIVWRDEPGGEIIHYRLKTVTYGTASAPYHATAALRQLAIEENHSFRDAAKVLQSDFYVYDLMSGAANIEEAIHIQSQLLELTSRRGFELRKWASNHQSVLAAVPPELRETTFHESR